MDTGDDYIVPCTGSWIGIPPEKLSTIFDGSSSTTSTSNDGRKGMGIGLSICKTIIVAHGGDIKATNHNNGAEFLFPHCQRRAQKLTHKTSILLVEDEKNICDFISTSLSAQDYKNHGNAFRKEALPIITSSARI